MFNSNFNFLNSAELLWTWGVNAGRILLFCLYFKIEMWLFIGYSYKRERESTEVFVPSRSRTVCFITIKRICWSMQSLTIKVSLVIIFFVMNSEKEIEAKLVPKLLDCKKRKNFSYEIYFHSVHHYWSFEGLLLYLYNCKNDSADKNEDWSDQYFQLVTRYTFKHESNILIEKNALPSAFHWSK